MTSKGVQAGTNVALLMCQRIKAEPEGNSPEAFIGAAIEPVRLARVAKLSQEDGDQCHT